MSRYSPKLMASLFGFFAVCGVAQPQDQLIIQIDRQVRGDQCIGGYIHVGNSGAIAHTLELPEIDNINSISAIPAGRYPVEEIREDGSRGWRIQIADVPQRGLVQIHVGNYTRDTEGCVLVGTGFDLAACTTTNSREGMRALRAAFATHNLGASKDLLLPTYVQIDDPG